MELVEGTIRPVGNSLCVLLPKALVRSQHLKSGQKVFLNIVTKRRISWKSIVGSLKGTEPFVREKEDRY